jgi:taurine transport system ATP-binding protein
VGWQGLIRPIVPFLDIRQVGVWYRSGQQIVNALMGISLAVEEGEFLCLVGPSGCGKTTLLHLVAGFLTPSKGEVLMQGQRITGPGSDRAVVMQHPTLLPWLTVYGNIDIGPRTRGISAAERRIRAKRYLDLVGLAEFADRHPYELSGGMQQRVAVARALANDPRMLLMDEPFGALDALTRETMQLELLRLWSLTGKTVIFVTHDVDEAVACGTRVIVLTPRPGRVVLDRRVEFCPTVLADAHNIEALRAVKSSPAFINAREEVMRAILASHGSDSEPVQTPSPSYSARMGLLSRRSDERGSAGAVFAAISIRGDTR